MTIDPFVGLLIGLVATVAIGFLGAWFGGAFERLPVSGQRHTPAE
jgi:hypothetical protein